MALLLLCSLGGLITVGAFFGTLMVPLFFGHERFWPAQATYNVPIFGLYLLSPARVNHAFMPFPCTIYAYIIGATLKTGTNLVPFFMRKWKRRQMQRCLSPAASPYSGSRSPA